MKELKELESIKRLVVDIEVFPNIFILGYIPQNENVKKENITPDDCDVSYLMLYNNRFYFLNAPNYTWEPIENNLSYLLDFNTMLSTSEIIAHNGYGYDFPIIQLLKLHLYKILYHNQKYIPTFSKKSLDIKNSLGFLIEDNTYDFKFTNNNIYNLSKLIIQSQDVFGVFKARLDKELTDKVKKHNNIQFELNKLLQFTNPNRKSKYLYNLYNLNLLSMSSRLYKDTMLTISDTRIRGLKNYGFEVLGIKYEADFDFEEEFDINLLDKLLEYNKIDIYVTNFITTKPEFKSYFKSREITNQLVINNIKQKSSNEVYETIDIVSNALTGPQIGNQFALSHINICPVYNGFKIAEYNEIGNRLRPTNYFIKRQFRVLDKYKSLCSPNITKKGLLSIVDRNLLRDFKPLKEILDLMCNYIKGFEIEPELFMEKIRPKDDKNTFDKIYNVNVSLGNDFYDKHLEISLKLGGLHSKVRDGSLSTFIKPDDNNYIYAEFDVASYYPFLIITLDLFSPFLKECGLDISYRNLRDLRVDIKHFVKGALKSPLILRIEKELNIHLEASKDATNPIVDAFKLILNSIFGQLSSKYSILFNPLSTYTVTLVGQATFCLILQELAKFDINELQIIYVNTDGIFLRIRKDKFEFYKNKFIDVSQRIGNEIFGEDIPFDEPELYEGLRYANVNNLSKIKSLELLEKEKSILKQIELKNVILKGGEFKTTTSYNVQNKFSTAQRLVKIEKIHNDEIDIRDQLTKYREDKELQKLFLSNIKRSSTQEYYIIKDNSEELITKYPIYFYPSKTGHTIKAKDSNSNFSSFVPFNVKILNSLNLDSFSSIILSEDFDFDTVVNQVEQKVSEFKKGINLEKEIDYEENGDYVSTFNNDISPEIKAEKEKLIQLGFGVSPADCKKNLLGVKNRIPGDTIERFNEKTNNFWSNPSRQITSIKVALPDDMLCLDFDKPECFDDKDLEIIKSSSNFVIGNTKNNNFKCFFKIPQEYQKKKIYFDTSKQKKQNESAVEYEVGYMSSKVFGVFGRHSIANKKPYNYKTISKPQNGEGISLLPQNIIDNYLKIGGDIAEKKTRNNFDNLSPLYTTNENVELLLQSYDRPEWSKGLFDELFELIPKENEDVDYIKGGNTHEFRRNTIWRLLTFGYHTHTLPEIKYKIYEKYEGYDELKNFVTNFDIRKQTRDGMLDDNPILLPLLKVCREVKFQNIDNLVKQIVIDETKQLNIEVEFNSDLLKTDLQKAAFIEAIITLQGQDSGLLKDNFEENKLNENLNLTIRGNVTKSVNTLKNLGFNYTITQLENNKNTINNINSSTPTLNISDPRLEDDIDKELHEIILNDEIHRIFDEGQDCVNLLSAPTGCGKTYSVIKELCNRIYNNPMSGCAVLVVENYEQIRTYLNYFKQHLKNPEQEIYDIQYLKNDQELSVKDIKEIKVVNICSQTYSIDNGKQIKEFITEFYENKVFILMLGYTNLRYDCSFYRPLIDLIYTNSIDILVLDEIHNIFEGQTIEFPIKTLKTDNKTIDEHSLDRCRTIFAKPKNGVILDIQACFSKEVNEKDIIMLTQSKVNESNLRPNFNKPTIFDDTLLDEWKVDEYIKKTFTWISELNKTSFTINNYENKDFFKYIQNTFASCLVEKSDEVKQEEELINEHYKVSKLIETLINNSPTCQEIINNAYYLSYDKEIKRTRIVYVTDINHFNNCKINKEHLHYSGDLKHSINTLFVPIISVLDVSGLSLLLNVSKTSILMSATYKTETRRLLSTILKGADKFKYKYWSGKKTEDLFLKQPLIYIYKNTLDYIFKEYNQTLDIVYNYLEEKDDNKLVIFSKTDKEAEYLKHTLIKNNKYFTLKKAQYDVKASGSFIEEHFNGKFDKFKCDKFLILSALGVHGTGYNLPDYSVAIVTTDLHKPSKSYGNYKNDIEFEYFKIESAAATVVQNAGRHLRLRKGEDNGRRVLIIDGLEKLVRQFVDLNGDIYKEISYSQVFLRTVLKHYNQNFLDNEIVLEIKPRTIFDENKIKELDTEEDMCLRIKYMLQDIDKFLISGYVPDLEEYQKVYKEKVYHNLENEKNKDNKKKTITFDEMTKLCQDKDFVRKYHCNFKNIKKDYKIEDDKDYLIPFIKTVGGIILDLINNMSLNEELKPRSLKKFLIDNDINYSLINKKAISTLEEIYLEKLIELIESKMLKDGFKFRDISRKYNLNRIFKNHHHLLNKLEE